MSGIDTYYRPGAHDFEPLCVRSVFIALKSREDSSFRCVVGLIGRIFSFSQGHRIRSSQTKLYFFDGYNLCFL